MFPSGPAAKSLTGMSKSLTFDRVYPPDSKQEDVYSGALLDDMVEHVIGGFHSTVFCYGQTGAGKTYTMDGYKYKKDGRGIYLPQVDSDPNTRGLVQRSISDLVTKI